MLEGLTTQLATLYARRKLDLRMVLNYLRDGRGLDLVLSRAPMWHAPDSPSTVGIELTNVCQLRCAHCDAQHPMIRGTSGYMSDDTFAHLVKHLRALRTRNLHVIGGGEPTLHPKFAEFLYRLHGLAPFISVTTNGLRLPDRSARAALRVLDVLEISVASDNAVGYARSRGGADFNRLLGNLATLRSLRDRIGSRTTIQIRVMLRPSERAATLSLLRFWSRHGDVVSTQMLQNYFEQPGDAYPRAHVEGFPSCVMPFRMLDVSWNGDVPLCRGSAHQTRSSDGILLGNIHNTSLAEMWHGPLIAQYREGHRRRAGELMPICRGCPDAQAPSWTKRYDNNTHLAHPAADFVPLSSVFRSRMSDG